LEDVGCSLENGVCVVARACATSVVQDIEKEGREWKREKKVLGLWM
jgi:hypothetical protein